MWGLSYWVFPIISAFVWVVMLISMLSYWSALGRPRYASMADTQSFAYISDIGASTLKPWFIAGSVVTTLFLDLALASERWLRHNGRLVKNVTTTEKVLSALSIICAIVGTVGLILLSVYDTLRYPRLHDVFLALFLGGYIFSAIFTCWEYQRLGIYFREHRILRISFWIKLAFILVEVLLAIAFGVLITRGQNDAGAIVEWTIAFIFTFYAASYFFDLRPAVHTRQGKFNGETEMQVEANDVPSQEHEAAKGRHI